MPHRAIRAKPRAEQEVLKHGRSVKHGTRLIALLYRRTLSDSGATGIGACPTTNGVEPVPGSVPGIIFPWTIPGTGPGPAPAPAALGFVPRRRLCEPEKYVRELFHVYTYKHRECQREKYAPYVHGVQLARDTERRVEFIIQIAMGEPNGEKHFAIYAVRTLSFSAPKQNIQATYWGMNACIL